MRIRRIVHAGGLFTALALVSACDGSAHEEEVTGLPNSGELRVDYTIDGQSLESGCERLGADRMALVVFVDEARYAQATVPCENFAVSIDLPADVYDVTATLLNAAGVAVTPMVELTSIRLEPGGSALSINFQSEVIRVPDE